MSNGKGGTYEFKKKNVKEIERKGNMAYMPDCKS